MKQPRQSPQLTIGPGEESWDMTLQGQAVLRCGICLPKLTAVGRGPGRIAAHYRRLERLWREYMQKELYLWACLDYANRCVQGRSFKLWQGRLEGEVVYDGGGLLSLRMTWTEKRGYERPVCVTWGDCWLVEQGSVCPLGAFLPHKRLKKRWIGAKTGLKERVSEFCLGEDGLHLLTPTGQEHILRVD